MRFLDIDKYLDMPIQTNNRNKAPIVIYGAGGFTKSMFAEYQSNGIIPIAICDSDTSKIGTNILGYNIISIDDVVKLYSDFSIIISVGQQFWGKVRENLARKIGEDRFVYYTRPIYDLYMPNTENEFKSLLDRERLAICNIYNNLADDTSKIVIENIIKARMTNDTKHLIASYTSMNDTNDILAFNEEECYLDCGAFTGDTVEMFILKVDDKYNKIFAFEPSRDIFMQLQSLIENKYNNDSRIVLIKKGLYSSNRKIGFDSSYIGSAHRIDDNAASKESIQVVAIDDVINEKVTFIKMDIEGSELDALKGAKNTILKYKPKLAISIYHKLEDIITIPKFIMDLGLDYKYYIRHHGIPPDAGCETVLYAV